MSRCVNCDANSSGLSLYRADGNFTASHFHTLPGGDMMCDECYEAYSEQVSDYDLMDTIEEEQGEAYDYD